MESVNFTSELRKHFGIKSCHMIIDSKDYITMLMSLSDENITICATTVDFDAGIQIKITFPSNYGNCEIDAVIDDIKDGNMVILECSIKGHNKNDFFIEFQNYLNNLIAQKKRKEERILCTKKNRELLKLNTIIFLNYRSRRFRAVIKDISYSGIKILSNPILLQAENEKFSFSLFFNEPEEKFFFVRCPIVRKNTLVFEDTVFSELVFKLPENIKFRKRLDNYFRQNKIAYKR